MKLTFCGAAQIVTGSCYWFKLKNKQFLIDCGMFQGRKDITQKNYLPLKFDPQKIDFMILTHAHIDHSGLIPKIVKLGFKGKIYCHSATKDLCNVMLQDSGALHEMEVKWKNTHLERRGELLREPLYTKEDAVKSMKFFIGCNYDEEIKISEDIRFTLRDAGHIMGSEIVELFIKENKKEIKFVFSGDLGQKNVPIIKDPTIIESADYIFIESTYGDRLHEDVKQRSQILKDTIKKAVNKGGKLIIPSFAVERTQELLYDLNLFFTNKQLPKIKTYIDSPLAIHATEIFKAHPECFDKETQKLLEQKNNPFEFPDLVYSMSTEQSKSINECRDSCIIIAGSGMCTGGRIKHHLKHNIWNEKNTILFVGYQAEGTLGRQIQDGKKRVRFLEQDFIVKAEVTTIGSYSAHADQNQLIEWLGGFKTKPKTVFVVHGEPKPAKNLARLAKEKYKMNCKIPSLYESIDIN